MKIIGELEKKSRGKRKENGDKKKKRNTPVVVSVTLADQSADRLAIDLGNTNWMYVSKWDCV